MCSELSTFQIQHILVDKFNGTSLAVRISYRRQDIFLAVHQLVSRDLPEFHTSTTKSPTTQVRADE